MGLSSPNRMVWNYFDSLRQLTSGLNKIEDELELKHHLVICITLAIMACETFVNVYFRVLVSEPWFSSSEQDILKDISKRKSLDYKIKNWPKKVLGNSLDMQKSEILSFLELKDHRNKLMHFTSTHEGTTKNGDFGVMHGA